MNKTKTKASNSATVWANLLRSSLCAHEKGKIGKARECLLCVAEHMDRHSAGLLQAAQNVEKLYVKAKAEDLPLFKKLAEEIRNCTPD
jgi:hypothetical protein